eukprot:Gb_16283 [translate_table: standard]
MNALYAKAMTHHNIIPIYGQDQTEERAGRDNSPPRPKAQQKAKPPRKVYHLFQPHSGTWAHRMRYGTFGCQMVWKKIRDKLLVPLVS